MMGEASTENKHRYNITHNEMLEIEINSEIGNYNNSDIIALEEMINLSKEIGNSTHNYYVSKI